MARERDMLGIGNRVRWNRRGGKTRGKERVRVKRKTDRGGAWLNEGRREKT